MAEEKVSFKVKGNKFWILEQRLEEGEKKARRKEEEEYNVNAWVFNTEEDAIKKLGELFKQEEIDFDKLDEISEKYNLQEVEIARDKYNMKAMSWLKVAAYIASKKL